VNGEAVPLALAASFCTATSSVCQRLGARATEDTSGFDLKIVFRLVRQPIWLVGVASMILGFVFQVLALHVAELVLVQPILAMELLIVFAYMSLISARSVKLRDWLAVVAMAVGLGLFLFTAAPSGGRPSASGPAWWWAGLVTLAGVLFAMAVAFGWARRAPVSPTRKAASLGIATGVAWGFEAAVIKEMSSHIDSGLMAILSNWSFAVLIAVGAMAMLLVSHALSAGPLAASQPGFTIADPVVASLLGVFLFGEHIRVGTLDILGEVFSLMLLSVGVVVLSHSQIVVPHPPSKREASKNKRR